MTKQKKLFTVQNNDKNIDMNGINIYIIQIYILIE